MLRKTLVAFFFLPGMVLAQVDSTKLQFYPLHIGDVWQYRGNSGGFITNGLLPFLVLSERRKKGSFRK